MKILDTDLKYFKFRDYNNHGNLKYDVINS